MIFCLPVRFPAKENARREVKLQIGVTTLSITRRGRRRWETPLSLTPPKFMKHYKKVFTAVFRVECFVFWCWLLLVGGEGDALLGGEGVNM